MQPGVVSDCGQGEGGSDSRRGNDVVPACVSQPGQGVVLDAQGDVEVTRNEVRTQRRRQAVAADGGTEASVGQDRGDDAHGVVLLERELWMGVHLAREFVEDLPDRFGTRSSLLVHRRDQALH